ncbi:cytochrome c [Aurantibacter crassamenti]|uniref:c-type cytochrome n=1 Tax=Aurantibacter crassamenti TaxID=1837375 RepID=UPI00193A628F|nr:c-type cytochrome [Aurantibacter crassamenti]MBM1107774.1 cytochrome c [Aurantibacter crassamenti]
MKIIISIIIIDNYYGLPIKKPTNYGNDIITNVDNITNGFKIFNSHCSSCHSFKSKVIGPNLSGVSRTVTTKWLKSFITDSANGLKNPIPEKITASGMSMNLEFITQVPATSTDFPLTRINKMGY